MRGLKMQRKTRVLLAKAGLDGHERGVRVVGMGLRDAGMEVLYTGLYNTPEMIVRTAIQEDVDVLGLSTLSGGHMELCSRILELLKEEGKEREILFIAGGIIPQDEGEALKRVGVSEIFREATKMGEIVKFIENNVKKRDASFPNQAGE